MGYAAAVRHPADNHRGQAACSRARSIALQAGIRTCKPKSAAFPKGQPKPVGLNRPTFSDLPLRRNALHRTAWHSHPCLPLRGQSGNCTLFPLNPLPTIQAARHLQPKHTPAKVAGARAIVARMPRSPQLPQGGLGAPAPWLVDAGANAIICAFARSTALAAFLFGSRNSRYGSWPEWVAFSRFARSGAGLREPARDPCTPGQGGWKRRQ